MMESGTDFVKIARQCVKKRKCTGCQLVADEGCYRKVLKGLLQKIDQVTAERDNAVAQITYCMEKHHGCTPKDLAADMRGWISVKDGLPEPMKTVLVVFRCSRPILAQWTYTKKWNGIMGEATNVHIARMSFGPALYWMPIPEPPKESEKDG